MQECECIHIFDVYNRRQCGVAVCFYAKRRSFRRKRRNDQVRTCCFPSTHIRSFRNRLFPLLSKLPRNDLSLSRSLEATSLSLSLETISLSRNELSLSLSRTTSLSLALEATVLETTYAVSISFSCKRNNVSAFLLPNQSGE